MSESSTRKVEIRQLNGKWIYMRGEEVVKVEDHAPTSEIERHKSIAHQKNLAYAY
jgi:hypothetical protein